MNIFELVCYSANKKYLDFLLSETQNCFGDSTTASGFMEITALFEHLNNASKKGKIQLIILDIQESNNSSLQFLAEVNGSQPTAVKLIISEGTHLLTIQQQFKELDGLHYLNHECSPEDLKVAVINAVNNYSNLQILINHKSETSVYSKTIEENKSSQLEELLKSNRTKEKLFSIIAHDLKSPFTALLGISELLISEWDELAETEKLDFIKGLQSTSENAHLLLENLLNWAKSQKENNTTQAKSFYVSGAIKPAIEITEFNAKQKGIEIINLVAEDFQINADENMISTVFRNLISNAVKYIPEKGWIKITAEPGINFHHFCIADNGDGIMDQDILDHFNQDQSLAKNNFERFRGIGLLLCQDFVKSNGGRMWLESKKGEGSKFCFTIPSA